MLVANGRGAVLWGEPGWERWLAADGASSGLLGLVADDPPTELSGASLLATRATRWTSPDGRVHALVQSLRLGGDDLRFVTLCAGVAGYDGVSLDGDALDEAEGVMALLVDEERRVIDASRSLELHLGWPAGSLAGVSAKRALGLQAYEALQHDPTACAEGRHVDAFVSHRSGQTIPMRLACVPLGSGPSSRRLVWLRPAWASRAAMDWYIGDLASVSLALLVVDERGVILKASPQAGELFLYETSELVGSRVDLLIPQRYRAEHPARMRKFMVEGQSRRMGDSDHVLGLRKDGLEIPLEIGLSPVRAGDRVLTLASIIDIRRRKQQEEARARQAADLRRKNGELSAMALKLEQALRATERRNRDQEQLVRAISHDLRAPLRGIRHLATWIEERAAEDLDAQSVEWLRALQDRTGRMDSMLLDLLSYARAMDPESKREETDPRALVLALRDLLSLPAAFELAVEGDLARVVTDRVPLEQVLRNLVDNAFRHHDREAGRILVRVTRLEHDALDWTVEDDGPGLLPDKAEELFGLFRAGTRSRGTGVGLTMVRRIVEVRGGRIWVEPAALRGARFRFTWPLVSLASERE
ncbi:MAG: PAS domain-containing sensor histidine kinase [Planctomycetes bacterium]|nr:PAS domain-containing sensor histidine kinase [Planctomycetota bacterium]